ncbi:UDP-glucuronosyltransferase 2C1-like isoform X1 [Salvelinus namaycush]|uniref:UDP-glucuronosyltransferase n=1 Tax=Salvelinus namaycush TaxID=8040 RepID=A0A8U0QTV5_SALNM|nr:UDP-glucuronosyltransferase 2C1-like isoform X1 [Salvelinus namaycush]
MCLPGIFIVTLLTLSIPAVHGGKVLVYPQDGSHWVNMKVIIEALHSRGHSVSVVRPSDSWYIKETSPHYTSITIDIPGGFDEDFATVFVGRLLEIQREGKGAWARFKLEMELTVKAGEMHEKICEMLTYIFENKELMKSLQDAKYDLVLTDPAMAGGVILAHYLSLPVVLNVRWTIHGEGHFAIAPSPLSYVPMVGAELTDKMTFLEKVKNVLIYVMSAAQIAHAISPQYTALVNQYFGPEVDYFSLFQAADLWLMRVDFVFEFPRPTMPNIIYMGGFQCKPAKPLPQELEEFVHSSGEHGVIIMSLGTLVAQLPRDLTDELAAAFAQLPQKVIWRHKGDRPTTLGNNTLLVDWMPQNDLLGHPKTRLFVAHGGTNGVQEAIYHGVPIVGLPLIFDQPDNLHKMKARGAAKILDIFTISRDIFLQALQEVLNEPSYRMNMQRLSRLHRDVPMEPLDTALFWIEFVMRHKGAAHLRTESYRMPWYSYHSVDVMVFLLAVLLLIMLTTVAIIRCLCFRMCSRLKIKHE